MENKAKITGYRELNQDEIDLMNEIKSHGAKLEELIQKLTAPRNPEGFSMDNYPDQRWVAIGKTSLQQGLMALVRAVAKPESF